MVVVAVVAARKAYRCCTHQAQIVDDVAWDTRLAAAAVVLQAERRAADCIP